jgi:hypothetical protein
MSSRTDKASKTIQAPASTIYQALVDPEALAKWLPPKGMSGKIDNFHLRQEGGYRMLSYDDPNSAHAGKSGATRMWLTSSSQSSRPIARSCSSQLSNQKTQPLPGP